MKARIVKLEIIDTDVEFNTPILATIYLISPDEKKLAELKHMIEHRHDALFDENATDEEIVAAEELCDNIWDNIYGFIEANFVVLDINETYEIEY